MASAVWLPSLFFLLFHLTPTKAAGAVELIFEEGYSVSTVLDGDKYKFKVNPYSILPQYPSSDLFVLLDSVASTFYTVSLPTTSNEILIQRLAGNGQGGYKDGNLDSAMFNRPKSFAVDYKGNVYVAEKTNHAIRKITKSGVSTIAGGYSQIAGHTDGPASNASFSNDLELAFVPERCALMVSDHGNRLIRQINLKAEDCTRKSGSVLGATSLWLLGLGLSCIVGLIVGFMIRPYIIPFEGCKPLHWSETWKHCLMSLERQVVMLCCDSRNAIVNSVLFSLFRRLIMLSLSHLNLMFRFRIVESRTTCQKSVSLLNFDAVSSSSSSSTIAKSPWADDQLKDLLPFDKGLMLQANANEVIKQEEEKGSTNISSGKHGKIDNLILTHLANFEEQTPRVWSPEYLENTLGLIKRK